MPEYALRDDGRIGMPAGKISFVPSSPRMGTPMRQRPLLSRSSRDSRFALGEEDPSALQRIDRLIADFFSAFDNRAGTPGMAAILDCFADKAVVARRSGTGTELLTVAEFARPRIELLAGGALVDFHESETLSTTSIVGRGIAARVSRYRKSGLLNGERYAGSGTKLFQLVSLGDDWRIASLAWVDDEA
ncbi:MAG TPA: hypothetical protein VFS55_04675 [Dokdonella sp.]|nr:hypothetical protein [Dokdonella sp.]